DAGALLEEGAPDAGRVVREGVQEDRGRGRLTWVVTGARACYGRAPRAQPTCHMTVSSMSTSTPYIRQRQENRRETDEERSGRPRCACGVRRQRGLGRLRCGEAERAVH